MAIAVGLLLAAGLYLFCIAPALNGRKKCPSWLRGAMFAHRGLYGMEESIPENSLAAFSKALEMGYGIELDVHLTLDGHLVVHHDRSLRRLCGADGNIDEMSLADLAAFCLQDTEEGIPSLSQVLALIDGKVPLLIEMKYDGGGDHTALPRALFGTMEGYAGPWCVESFDPMMLLWFRRHAPRTPRGQLAFDQKREAGKFTSPLMIISAFLLMNVISRPHFVAYGPGREQNLSCRLVRRLFHPLMGAWTVRTANEFEKLRDQNDLLIFEAFLPECDPSKRRNEP